MTRIIYNKLKNQDILNLDNLTEKFKSFNWHTIEIDGHNIESINNTLTINTTNNKPKAIIANTIKGKGVSLFENNNEWHHSILVKNYEIALKELDDNEKNKSFDTFLIGKVVDLVVLDEKIARDSDWYNWFNYKKNTELLKLENFLIQ